MKRFLKRLFLACGVMAVVLFAPVVVTLWSAECKVDKIFDDLKPTETVLFIGDSLTGCSITDYPNDDCRVFWRSAARQLFSLVVLKELERQGKLEPIKVCVTGLGYNSAIGFDSEILKERNLRMFGLTWKYSHLFPMDVFYSTGYLRWYRYRLRRNPLKEEPPQGRPFHLLEEEKRERILQAIRDYATVSDAQYEEWHARLLKALVEMQAVCQRNNVKMVVVFTPHISWFEEKIPAAMRERIVALYESLPQYGIHTIDCRTAMGDEYFRDGVHLLPEGSKRFTEMFMPMLAPLRVD